MAGHTAATHRCSLLKYPCTPRKILVITFPATQAVWTMSAFPNAARISRSPSSGARALPPQALAIAPLRLWGASPWGRWRAVPCCTEGNTHPGQAAPNLAADSRGGHAFLSPLRLVSLQNPPCPVFHSTVPSSARKASCLWAHAAPIS